MRRADWFLALTLFCLSVFAARTAFAVDTLGGDRVLGQKAGFSIVETGKNADGKALYNVKADSADIADVLKAIFLKMGEPPYLIQENVRGTLNFSLKEATLDEILQGVQKASVPPIKITSGKVTTVSRAFDAKTAAALIQQRIEDMHDGIGLSGPATLPGAQQGSSPLDRPVTLNIAYNRPILLSEALLNIEKQTGVSIRLDKNIPTDIRFTATVTHMPLRYVLQNIAPGDASSALKTVVLNDYILIAPTDRLEISRGPNILGSTLLCLKCRQPLSSGWSFCPNCGQTTPRGLLLNQNRPNRNTGGIQKIP
jgi:hypothetical protein